MFIHPHPDPVALSLFGLSIRWYGLMYLTGLFIAWGIGRQLLKRQVFSDLRGIDLEDFIVASALGIIVGGRLGSVLFYNLSYYLEHPVDILRIWTGGMSFHGGLVGVIIGLWVLGRYRAHSIATGPPISTANTDNTDPLPLPPNLFLRLVDFAAVLTPPGLGLGRLGNFINAELPGRIASADLPWAFNFGYPDSLPRHPSQLYQMIIEGLLLTGLMLWLSRRPRPPGWLAGMFLIAYGISRLVVEFFREPDNHLGLLLFNLSMGQWLSLPMILIGMLLVYRLPLKAMLAGKSASPSFTPLVTPLHTIGRTTSSLLSTIRQKIGHFFSTPDTSEYGWDDVTNDFDSKPLELDNKNKDTNRTAPRSKNRLFSFLSTRSEDDSDEDDNTPYRTPRRQKRRSKKKKQN